MSRQPSRASEGVDPEDGFYRLNADGGIVAEQGQSEGEAGIGVVLRRPDGSVREISARIGWVKDHHVAEYHALIRGLRLARTAGIEHIKVFLDSALVVNQVNNDWKVVKEHLKPLWMEARTLVQDFTNIDISHVARRENSEAHALADEALAGVRSRTE